MQSRKKIVNHLILAFMSVVVLSGCATTKSQPPYFKDIYESTRASREAGQPAPPSGQAEAADKGEAAQLPKSQVKIITLPNSQLREKATVAAEKPAPAVGSQPPATGDESKKQQDISMEIAAGAVQVVVENMPLYDFVNLALGDILKLNYTVAQEVQTAREKITLNMSRKMEGKDFFPFVIELLRKNNLEIREENLVLNVRVKGQQTAQSIAPSSEIYVGSIPAGMSPQKRITLIVTTSYVPATQILQVVRQLQLVGGDVKIDTPSGTQLIALTGTVSSLEKVIDLFNQLDRVSYADRDFNLVYFDFINVVDFDKKMREVLPAMGIPFGRNPSDTGLLTITFDKINALLVMSQRKEWLDTLLSWKDKLDAAESMGDELQLFLYHPKNRTAEDLVSVLKSISGGTTSTAAAAAAPGQKQAAPAKGAAAAPAVAAGGVLPGKGFSAIFDKGRNTVIISASPANFKLIRNVLLQLDTPPKQILIEATISEVTLNDQLQFGVEWFIKHTLNSGKYGDFEGTISTLGGLALGSTGLNYAITKFPGDFQAKLNMFANQNLINIVSTPHIVMLDGKEATINVGTEVPIVTAETTASDIGSTSSGGTTAPSILRSVQYRNTGVILRVKPVVNAEGVLTVEINQELSEAQINSVSSIDSPLILNRSISTTLSVKSGDTVLLGGLISSNKSTGESKVPFLGDLPLIGRLFKTDSTGTKKTELIVQITPYILNDLDQLEEMTKKFRNSTELSRAK